MDALQRRDADRSSAAAAGDRRVQGVATAAGCQLVATCDLAVASHAAQFATPGVDIGLFCSTPMVALSRNVSRKHAMEMLLTGEMLIAPTMPCASGCQPRRSRRALNTTQHQARAHDRGEVEPRP